jgi:hypothetical protein
MEPYKIYDKFLMDVEKRADAVELLRDVLLVSEGSGNALTMFADDPNIFASGLVTRDWVGSTQPNEHGFEKIKTVVGKAGIHGSWFGWFGRFSESGPGQIENIHEIPRWHQLAREMASWDNLTGVALNQRHWDGSTYLSTNSCMSDAVLYSRQPNTRKIFAVFMDDTGSIPLKAGEQVESIQRVDGLFREAGDGGADLEVLAGNIVVRD